MLLNPFNELIHFQYGVVSSKLKVDRTVFKIV